MTRIEGGALAPDRLTAAYARPQSALSGQDMVRYRTVAAPTQAGEDKTASAVDAETFRSPVLRLDPATNRTVMQIRDSDTGKVTREHPRQDGDAPRASDSGKPAQAPLTPAPTVSPEMPGEAVGEAGGAETNPTGTLLDTEA